LDDYGPETLFMQRLVMNGTGLTLSGAPLAAGGIEDPAGYKQLASISAPSALIQSFRFP
jgi:hypothetical protein